MLAGLGYLAVWWPKIWIEDVQVEGKAVYYSVTNIKEIAWQKIGRPLWRKVPRQSIILVPIYQIKKDILNKYPEIKTVEVVRHLPRSLVIKIEERDISGFGVRLRGGRLRVGSRTPNLLGVRLPTLRRLALKK